LKGDNKWVKIHGSVKYEEIQHLYSLADIGIFASSCETYGQIVSESMAASLPIACSCLSSMKDVIKEDTVYFHPENPEEIAFAIRKLILSIALRKQNAERGYENAVKLSWERTAEESFEFFKTVYTNFREVQTKKTNDV
jgi:glycosyltransferase involved in cell wall biosynthesis